MSDYLTYQNKCNFKIGDKVKVIRRCTSYVNDWDNSWVSEMDNYVGKVFDIKFINDNRGIELNMYKGGRSYNFPYFVLEKHFEVSLPDELFKL